MPYQIGSMCSVRGCPSRAVRGGRCYAHARAHDAARPTRSERGYDYAWSQIRAAFLREYPACYRCGMQATDVHHIVPLASGGTHDEGNLQSLCHSCHSRVTAGPGRGRQKSLADSQ
jgi:5-methylcytosine-specific restriction protein A